MKSASPPQQASALQLHQEIRFCTGVRWRTHSLCGGGRRSTTSIKAANWLNHLEYDWESPVWRGFLLRMAEDRIAWSGTIERGNGLSDWDVAGEQVSQFSVRVDSESVADAASVRVNFRCSGSRQNCAVLPAYAKRLVRHPEARDKTVLYGRARLKPRGWRRKRGSQAANDEADAPGLTLIRLGWGQENAGIPADFHVAIYSRRHR